MNADLRGLLEELPRAEELAERLCASGPKAAHVSCSETHEIKDFILAAASVLRSLSVAQGQGFVMVPRVPTEAMRATFRAEKDSGTFFTHTTLQCADFDSRYAAMLSAAPAQPDGVE